MDKEVNIPTLFSCFLIVTCALLISLIIKRLKNIQDPIEIKWKYLRLIFIFLALDEGLQIHEILIIPDLKPMLPPLLTVIWVIPYGIFSLWCLLYFMPLLISLPKRIKNLTLVAGATYISGALGLEMVGSSLVRTGDIKLHGISYGLISTFEETLEMAGLIIFIHSLLLYIFYYQNQKLKIKFLVKGNNQFRDKII